MSGERLSLLVVEDEALIAMELEDLLVDLGHSVPAVAGTVERAVSLVAKLDRTIDAALVDMNLGGRPATPVIAALSEADVPFLIMSGYGEHELRQWGLDAPHVRKPYQRQQIERALAKLSPRISV